MKSTRHIRGAYRNAAFLDRESGGYSTSVASAPGPATREVASVITAASVAAVSVVEQTFTVPGVLSTDRLWGVTPAAALSSTSNIGISASRVSAASVISLSYVNPSSAAVTPTSTQTLNLLIGSPRAG